jgi:hypothetical protein
VLNANGREVGSYDSQPTKYAARELVVRRTLLLDHVIQQTPGLADRPAFGKTVDGHVRSSYPVLPSILAAGPGWLLGRLGWLDLEAPGAPTVIAKVTASLLVALAAVFAFLIASRRTSLGVAALVAVGYVLGTNTWLSGQTLGGHETVAFGLTGALLVIAAPGTAISRRGAWAAATMLAVAGAARAQVAPAVAILALALLVRSGFRHWLPLSVLAVASGLVAGYNTVWFGHILGNAPHLESLHATVHATTGTFTTPWNGALGLLVSPSRGLVVFSPVVLVCLLGVWPALREGWKGPLFWCLLAGVAQLTLYSCYTVWWGGHAYGPRYALDALPPFIPIAAVGAAFLAKSLAGRAVGVVVLAWSIALAATGAFSYPADRWNNVPSEVDQHHERLWDWNDMQFVRCWKVGLSPQNFDLFQWDAFHPPKTPTPSQR